jgi:hypothetical protein
VSGTDSHFSSISNNNNNNSNMHMLYKAEEEGIPEEREVAGVDDADQCRLWYDKT